MKNVNFDSLIGKTIIKIEGLEKNSDRVVFYTSDGNQYTMLHYQDCCESVEIYDINGDIEDLLNTPILKAEEYTSDKNPEGIIPDFQDISYTWTFYTLATAKGYVDIRWYGTSNGWYSESVDFEALY